MNEYFRQLENQKILILGFGREGKSTYHYLRSLFPQQKLFIADKQSIAVDDPIHKDPFATVITGQNYLSISEEYDWIIKTPGIVPSELVQLRQNLPKTKWTSQSQIFLSMFRDRVIGITGTKGKSTTTSLIYHLLQTAGKKVRLVGNIGVPFFDLLDEDSPETLYCAELSSHQLSETRVSPHIGVLLNIYQEHLDYYESFEAYRLAKMNITQFQTDRDVFIFNSDQKEVVPNKLQSNIVNKQFSLIDSQADAWSDNDSVWSKAFGKVCNLTSLPLKGQQNIANILAAILVVEQYGLSLDEAQHGIMTFQPLDYRLETVGIYRGITFIDDSLATIPEATVAALNSFDQPIKTLLVGGYDRGQNYSTLASEIVAHAIDHVILFPATGSRIEKEINSHDVEQQVTCHHVESMAEAITLAFAVTPANSICLHSPAAPSFSLFKDYRDRSNQFRSNLTRLGTDT